MRAAIVASHPIQHFCPFYRQLAEERGIELKVFFGSQAGYRDYVDAGYGSVCSWGPTLLDGFDYEWLPGAESCPNPAHMISNDHVERCLRRFDPDVVQVYGYFHGVARSGIRFAGRKRARLLMMTDSELRTPRSAAKRVRHRLVLPRLFRQVTGFLTIGDANEEYYRHYGIRDDRLFRSPYPIDDALLDAALLQRPNIRSSIRSELRIDQHVQVGIVVGKLTERKKPVRVIDALRHIPDTVRRTLEVLLIGDGPLRPELETRARATGVSGVKIVGFVPPTDLVRYYAAADFLVHPADYDPHPLATSEAVFMGLPVVASAGIGSVGPTDDLRPGENVLTFPPGRIDQLRAAIERLATDPGCRTEMAVASRRIAEQRTLSVSVKGFLAAATGDAA